MAYEDTHCPCGGKKIVGNMLCFSCEADFADRPELTNYQDIRLPWEARRAAAIVLVSLARGRRRA